MSCTTSQNQGSSLIIGDNSNINHARLFSNLTRIIQVTGCQQEGTLHLQGAELLKRHALGTSLALPHPDPGSRHCNLHFNCFKETDLSLSQVAQLAMSGRAGEEPEFYWGQDQVLASPRGWRGCPCGLCSPPCHRQSATSSPLIL